MSTQTHAPTRIVRDAAYLTEITFFHMDPLDQDVAFATVSASAVVLAAQPGMLAVNVLRSRDGSRICRYLQWSDAASLDAAHRIIVNAGAEAPLHPLLDNDAVPRQYRVVYVDDRSPEGISVISPDYAGTIFINEITTAPETQDRLLELVIANNEIQSLHTPGYRSANFHKSTDGLRAVNYSLWDTEEHCIAAISAMADMDENLDETVAIASPDFRFYELVFAAHA
jgi:heme-degrading monooxygenase HmoA